MAGETTKVLLDESEKMFQEDKPVVIAVDSVSMDYNFANEKLNSLKEYFIALAKRQLVFKRFRALDDISFDVQSGDVFGILGTNGSGKSTLLKIVSGVLDPTEGSVSVDGRIAPLIEMGAGFDYELTGRENVYLNGAMLGYSKSFISRHFDEIVDFSEIGEFIDLPLKNYSSGMVSRLAFAVATIIVPDILIVDEVLSVGDQMFRQKCERRMHEIIHEHGTTVLMVSHSSSEIERMCNKAVWIEKGHMRMIGDAKKVSAVYQALGGHKGTPEGEQYIFELMTKDCQEEPGKVEYIFGYDDFSINDKVGNIVTRRDKELDAAVILESNHPVLVFMSLYVAARQNAILVLSDNGKLTSEMTGILSSIKPSNILMLGEKCFDSGLMDNARRLCEHAHFDVIQGSNLSSLSIDLFEFMNANHSLGDCAIIAIGNVGSAAAVLSSLVMQEGMPILFFEKDDDMKSVADYVGENGFKKVIVLHGYGVDPGILLESLGDRGIEALSFRDEVTNESSKDALKWMVENQTGFVEVLVSPSSQPNSSFLSAPLGKHDKALSIPVDRINVDSVQVGCEAISRFAGNIKSIKLIGPEGAFDETDRRIFARASSVG